LSVFRCAASRASPTTCCWAQVPCSKIPSNLGTILPIGLTKLLVEVALLAQHNPAMHDDKERDQHDNAPPRIERQDKAEIEKRQGKIERIAGEAKRTGCDDGGSGKRGIHVRTCGLHRSSSPCRNPNAEHDQREAGPESNGGAKDWHWPELTKHKTKDKRAAVEQRRPRGDPGFVC